MNLSSYLENIYIIPILIFSVIIHEMAHAWVALRCGDTTARDLGRITLNPLPHIDIFGSIIIPLFSILATGRVLIAWAKPVPIDPRNFRNFKRDDTMVTVAGPLSNMLIALLCVFCTAAVIYINTAAAPADGSVMHQFLGYMAKMFYAGIFLNVTLALFNMIPIPPLDGSHVLANILPDETAYRFRSIGFGGIFIILMVFNFVPGFSRFFFSVITFVAQPYFNLLNLIVK